MELTCQICGLKRPGLIYTILGAVPPRIFRPLVTVCANCMDTCPCGERGKWDAGKITCPHGSIFTVEGEPSPPSISFKRVGLTLKARLKNLLCRGYRPCGQ